MSIDLPPLPLTPKDGEYLPRRPDHMYFPYLSSPFLNGMATKMNEISVIQSAVLNNGGLVSPPSSGMIMPMSSAPSMAVACGNSSTTTTTSIMNAMATMALTPTSNVDGAATALRHSTEFNMGCKKSPVPAEGARSSPSPDSCSSISKSDARTPIPSTYESGGGGDPGSGGASDADGDGDGVPGDDSAKPDLPSTPSSSSSSPSPPPSTPDESLGTSLSSGPWMWKMGCTLCNKVCSSPIELENHLKAHYKTDNKDHLVEIPKTEGLPV